MRWIVLWTPIRAGTGSRSKRAMVFCVVDPGGYRVLNVSVRIGAQLLEDRDPYDPQTNGKVLLIPCPTSRALVLPHDLAGAVEILESERDFLHVS